MNYNEYDSDGNKKSFDYSLLISDKKYRARLILGIYLVFFIIIIIFVRVGLSNSVDDYSSLENEQEQIPNEDDNEEMVNENDFSNEFSLVMLNNYNFEFTIYSDSLEFVAAGKRYNNKYELDLSSNGDIIKYISDGTKTLAYYNGVSSERELPYYYINYFDNEILLKILNNSKKVGNGNYYITNGRLIKFVNNFFKNEIDNKEFINIIKLFFENDKIVSINIDITNLVNSLLEDGDKQFSSVVLDLKYSDFGLIEDFEINF